MCINFSPPILIPSKSKFQSLPKSLTPPNQPNPTNSQHHPTPQKPPKIPGAHSRPQTACRYAHLGATSAPPGPAPPASRHSATSRRRPRRRGVGGRHRRRKTSHGGTSPLVFFLWVSSCVVLLMVQKSQTTTWDGAKTL